jgi:serine/threonine-protein kinase
LNRSIRTPTFSNDRSSRTGLPIAWSSAALAQPAGAQAEVLFRQGRDLMVAGKLAEACNAFEESQKLEPAVTTLLNLAGCREKLGQLATAWGLFLDAARQTRSATDAASQQLHHVAAAHAQQLEPRVSRLTIKVPPPNQLDGLEITRAPDRIGAAMWNQALPIDGGTYTITAQAPGMPRWSTQVTVAPENDTKAVEIPDLRTLPRDDTRPAAHTPPPADGVRAILPRPTPPHTSSKAGPLVIGASGLALLGSGLGFELWAESRYAAAKSEMVSQPQRDSLYNAANTGRYLAEALAVSGLAACGAAVWLYLRDDSRKERAPTGANVRIVPTAAGLAVSGRF